MTPTVAPATVATMTTTTALESVVAFDGVSESDAFDAAAADDDDDDVVRLHPVQSMVSTMTLAVARFNPRPVKQFP